MWILDFNNQFVRLVLVILFVLFCHWGFSQSKIDSLQKVLQTEISDSLKVLALTDLASLHNYTNLAKMKAYANEALALAEKKGYVWGKILAYYQLGSYGSLTGDFTSAFKYDNLSVEAALITRDSSYLIIGLNSVGNDYYDLGKYDDAYRYFTDTYRLSQKTGDSLFMSVGIHNVGRVFKELGQYDRAISHLKIAGKISALINDETGPAYTLDELGDVYMRVGKYDSALEMLTQSLALTRKFQIGELESRTLTKIAKIYSEKGNYDLSIQYSDSVINLHQRNGNSYGMADAQLGKSRALIMQKKYDQALPLIEKSLITAGSLNARVLEVRCYNQLALLWENKGDYKKAYGFFKQFKQMEDSLQNNEMEENLLREEMKSVTESKDAQIATLTQKEDQIGRAHV